MENLSDAESAPRQLLLGEEDHGRREAEALVDQVPYAIALIDLEPGVRVVGNVGLGILGDPTDGQRQNDVLTYGSDLELF